MAKLFQTFLGHEREIRDWLALEPRRHPEDPSLHDLLDLDESCRDAELVRARKIEQTNKLRRLEPQLQRSNDPAVMGLLNRLMQYIASAERLLCDPERFEEYRAELLEYRAAKLRRVLALHYQPGQPLEEEETEKLVAEGEQLRLPRSVARTVVDEFLHPRFDIPEMYRDHVKWLGIVVFPEDPMWPSHFDVLGLADGEPAQPAEVQEACEIQMAKLAKLERHPDAEKKRQAGIVRQRVLHAAAELRDARRAAAYVDECRKHRRNVLQALVKRHQRLKGKLTEGGRLLLLRAAADLRLSARDAETVVEVVFGRGSAARRGSRRFSTFVFADGDQAATPEELGRLIAIHWRESRNLFDAFATWLRQNDRPDLEQATRRIAAQRDHLDLKIQNLISLLDPSLRPVLGTTTSPTIDLGTVRAGTTHTIEVELVRSGTGYIAGQATRDVPWATVHPEVFTLERSKSKTTLAVEVRAEGIPVGTAATGNLIFHSNGGTVTVTIRLAVASEQLQVGSVFVGSLAELAGVVGTHWSKLVELTANAELERWLARSGCPMGTADQPPQRDHPAARLQSILQALGLAPPPKVSVTPSECALQGSSRRKLEGTLRIEGKGGVVYGRVSCSDGAIRLEPKEFAGESPHESVIEVRFWIDRARVSPNTERQTAIVVETNAGRFRVPVRYLLALDRGRVIRRAALQWAMIAILCGLAVRVAAQLAAMWAFPPSVKGLLLDWEGFQQSLGTRDSLRGLAVLGIAGGILGAAAGRLSARRAARAIGAVGGCLIGVFLLPIACALLVLLVAGLESGLLEMTTTAEVVALWLAAPAGVGAVAGAMRRWVQLRK